MPQVHTAHNTNPVMGWVYQLKSRNPLLFWFGIFNLICALLCFLLTLVTDKEILGINAYIKPAKFFLSIGILGFTMSWYMVYLNNKRAVTIYSWVMIITMAIEMTIIVWQASNGRLSHFNISSQFYGNLFMLMGVAIVTFTLWTLYIGVLFFRQKNFPLDLPEGYIWGIRLGLLFFVIFAFEGGQMAAMLTHTIGGPDGSKGLPLVNWSKSYGDLRVAHFFGMHSLQVLPLMGFYLARTRSQIFLLAITWFLFVVILYWQAILGYPLLTSSGL
ncbi:MAG: hypothetical protein ACK57D_11250 [Sphingobacteriales bacterium]|jgi:hypothetical protein